MFPDQRIRKLGHADQGGIAGSGQKLFVQLQQLLVGIGFSQITRPFASARGPRLPR